MKQAKINISLQIDKHFIIKVSLWNGTPYRTETNGQDQL